MVALKLSIRIRPLLAGFKSSLLWSWHDYMVVRRPHASILVLRRNRIFHLLIVLIHNSDRISRRCDILPRLERTSEKWFREDWVTAVRDFEGLFMVQNHRQIRVAEAVFEGHTIRVLGGVPVGLDPTE